jgi:hypothetical protein
LAPFGSVLGLAWQPDPTALGPATKSNPIAFGKVGNTPQLQFLTKNTILDKKYNKEMPPSTVFITQIILFLILILLIIVKK